jgi:hypothetical protein
MIEVNYRKSVKSTGRRASGNFFWLLLVFLLFCSNTSGQKTDFYPPDYKSIKAISPTIGLIGFGFGGELRADINVGKYVFFGSVGYKDYGARDSMITVGGKQFQEVILSDCKGPILNVGIGMRIKRSESTKLEFVATDMYMTEDAFNYYLHYTGRNENLPHLKSQYVMLEVSSLPTAVYHRGPSAGSSVFIRGNNVYVSAILRTMDEIAPINRATIIDFGPMVCSDFKQVGVMVNYILINHHFNYSMELGLIRRFDKPANVIDPFEGDGAYKWGLPFQFTFGYTFIRQKRSSDFASKKP